MPRWMHKLIALLLGGVLMAPALGQSAPATSKSARVNQAIGLQKEAKHQLQELIQVMHKISRQLETSDPASARVIAAAVAKAEEAFIADNMDKVVRLLQQNLVVPADASQREVIVKLQEVLEVLRSGGDDLLARLIELERLVGAMSELEALLYAQRRLERRTRALGYPQEVDARFGQASKDAHAVLDKQHELHARTKDVVIDDVTQAIAGAGGMLAALSKRVDALAKSAADPYPSPDLMSTNIATARSLSTDVITARVTLKTSFNEKPLAEPIKAAAAGDLTDAIETSLTALNDALRSAAKQLQADDLDKGQLGVAEAREHIAAAIKTLETLVTRLPNSRGSALIVAEQQTLITRAEAALALIDELIPITEKSIVPAVNKNERPGSKPKRDRAAAAAPAKAEVAPVLAALRRLDKDSALAEQLLLAKTYTGWGNHIDAAIKGIEALRKDPAYPRQAKEQQQIGEGIQRVMSGELHASTRPGAASQPATSQPAILQGEIQVLFNRAIQRCNAAARQLADKNAQDANVEQREVIRLLETALAKLMSDFEGFAVQYAGELKEAFMADLERAMVAQKRCTLDTLDIYAKRQGDGSYKRTELLGISAVAQAESDIAVVLARASGLMKTATKGRFKIDYPPVCFFMLELARDDVQRVAKRLDDKDPGLVTQKLQAQIETRFDNIRKAMAGGEGMQKPPPAWGQNGGVLQVAPPLPGRSTEVLAIILLQAEAIRRTEEVDALKRAHKITAEQHQDEHHAILRLQQKIAEFTSEVVGKQLEKEAKNAREATK